MASNTEPPSSRMNGFCSIPILSIGRTTGSWPIRLAFTSFASLAMPISLRKLVGGYSNLGLDGALSEALTHAEFFIAQASVVDRPRLDTPGDHRRNSGNQEQWQDERAVTTRKFHHQNHGRDWSLGRGAKNGSRAKQGEQSERGSGRDP